jgi:hypothetical protein
MREEKLTEQEIKFRAFLARELPLDPWKLKNIVEFAEANGHFPEPKPEAKPQKATT